VPPLWILPPFPPKQYSNTNFAKVYDLGTVPYKELRSLPIYSALTREAVWFLLTAVWWQFLSFGLLLLGVFWARTRPSRNWLLGMVGIGAAGMFTEVWATPHYTAPFTAALLILIVASMRALWYRMAALRLRGPVFLVALAMLVTPVFLDYLNALQTPRTTPRSRVIQQLKNEGGRHLVLVDYADGWNPWTPDGEWVYNGADPDAAAVMFAHARSPRENREFLDRHADRTAWFVKVGPGETQMSLERYESQAAGISSSGAASRLP
jgi:uncharacterized Tic20 family protein